MVYPRNPSPAKLSRGEDLYDLVPEAPRAKQVGAAKPIAAAKQAINPPPAKPICSYRGTPHGEKVGKADLDVEKLKKQTAPLWMLAGGLTVEAIVTWLHARTNPAEALVYLFVGVGLGTLLMMAGVWITAWVREIDIGSFGSAMLRLAAIVIAPAALADVLNPLVGFIPFVGLGLFIIEFMLYFALLGMFFDLDDSDTWYCVGVIFVINLGVYFGVGYLVR
jgi:hypothetical protein